MKFQTKSLTRKKDIFNAKFKPGQFVKVDENCFDMIMSYAFVRARKVFVRVLNDKAVSIHDVRAV